jgi:hypothetical protein
VSDKTKAQAWDNYISKHNKLVTLMKKAGIDPILLDELLEAAKSI